MHQPIHAHQDARSGNAVLQGADPVSVDLGLLGTHAGNVADGLQVGNARPIPCAPSASAP